MKALLKDILKDEISNASGSKIRYQLYFNDFLKVQDLSEMTLEYIFNSKITERMRTMYAFEKYENDLREHAFQSLEEETQKIKENKKLLNNAWLKTSVMI